MKLISLFVLATLTAAASAQTGQWHDVSKDSGGVTWFVGSGGDSTKPILNEDYEVNQTHEICANVIGYYMEKSQQGRYNVYFKGMRTSSTFTFTTQYDAENWVKRWCTAESLTEVKRGKSAAAQMKGTK